jgi:hypothetical protein
VRISFGEDHALTVETALPKKLRTPYFTCTRHGAECAPSSEDLAEFEHSIDAGEIAIRPFLVHSFSVIRPMIGRSVLKTQGLDGASGQSLAACPNSIFPSRIIEGAVMRQDRRG